MIDLDRRASIALATLVRLSYLARRERVRLPCAFPYLAALHLQPETLGMLLAALQLLHRRAVVHMTSTLCAENTSSFPGIAAP